MGVTEKEGPDPHLDGTAAWKGRKWKTFITAYRSPVSRSLHASRTILCVLKAIDICVVLAIFGPLGLINEVFTEVQRSFSIKE